MRLFNPGCMHNKCSVYMIKSFEQGLSFQPGLVSTRVDFNPCWPCKRDQPGLK